MPRPAAKISCSAQKCTRSHYAKGYCKKHYTQILRHGELTPDRERGHQRSCDAPNCDRTDVGTDTYCRKHKRQVKVHGKLTPDREHQMGNAGCNVPGCTRHHRARGYCARHYNQIRWRKVKEDEMAREMARNAVAKLGIKKKKKKILI